MEENCNNNTNDIEHYDYQQLRQITFACEAKRFAIKLSTQTEIFVDQILRIMPRKRVVVRGKWNGLPVVAKLFFSKKAKLHAQQELNGIKKLKNNNIPSARLYFHGLAEDAHTYCIILENLVQAESFYELWMNRKDNQSILPELKRLVIEVATQHVLGVLQQDMHLGNFLLDEKLIYSLDGTSITSFQPLLNKTLSIENLALMVSQLGILEASYAEKLYRFYANARGWVVKPRDIMAFHMHIKKWHGSRWHHYEKKIIP